MRARASICQHLWSQMISGWKGSCFWIVFTQPSWFMFTLLPISQIKFVGFWQEPVESDIHACTLKILWSWKLNFAATLSSLYILRNNQVKFILKFVPKTWLTVSLNSYHGHWEGDYRVLPLSWSNTTALNNFFIFKRTRLRFLV